MLGQWQQPKWAMRMEIKKSALLALAAVMLTVALLWLTGNSVAPREATWQDALNEAQSGGYRLITTADLAREYETRGAALLVVDTRQEWEYRTGHIRGSIPFPIEPTGWSRWRQTDALATLLGPDKDRFIAFY
jgi:hypothetical protein